jgi:hypothetical protein
LVTADAELDPIDSMGYRAAIVDAFASRGIYPGEVRSLSEDAVRWELADVPDAVRCEGLDPDLSQADVTKKNAILLSGFAHARAKELGLSTKVPVVVKGFHPSTSKKIDAHGNVRPEFHVQIVQRRMEPLDPKDPGGPQFPFRGGTTVVLDETGRVRYLIGKRIEDRERLARQREHLLASASAGAAAAYRGPALRPLSLAALHRGVDG